MIDFLTPVSKTVLAHRELMHKMSLGKKMLVHTEKSGLPELSNIQLAIIGVPENRRDVNYLGNEISFNTIRKAIYSLYQGGWHTNIADLGNIESGETVEDTYFALKLVAETLLKQKIIPIILGGSQDLVYATYRAYDKRGTMVNLVNIDAMFDLGDADQPISNKSYIGKMVVDKPYNLFNYSNIGYQTYFNSADEIDLIEKLYFDAYRLGEITNDISIVEPITRDADIISLDLTAIKSSEISYKGTFSPNGFDGREICAISRYAGLSNRVSLFGVYEIVDLQDASSATMLVAQIIWYFIEGVNFRIDDGDFSKEKEYITYKVPIDNQVLIFKKSIKTQRWWIELPFISTINNKLKRHTLLPCTYHDYESACNQEIPNRWYKARRKNEV